MGECIQCYHLDITPLLHFRMNIYIDVMHGFNMNNNFSNPKCIFDSLKEMKMLHLASVPFTFFP